MPKLIKVDTLKLIIKIFYNLFLREFNKLEEKV